MDDLYPLLLELRSMSAERGWERLHTPNNLALAIAGEAGELCHLLRWGSEIPVASLESELADIFTFVLIMSDKLGINLVEAAMRKAQKTRIKYPPP